MTPKTRSTIVVFSILAVLFVLALPKLPFFKHDTPAAVREGSRDSRLGVNFLVAQSERLAEGVTTVGTILSNEEVEIRSEISGKVERVLFSESSVVHKGDTLLTVNDEELQARLLSARYRQELAEQNEERQKQLFGKSLASQQDFDAAVNQANVVRAEVQLIRAQLSKTLIRAPFAGALGLRFVSEGSYITPTTLITTLHDNHIVKIDFTVPERYAGEVPRGTTIAFRIQGSRDNFTARVYAIAPSIDPATRTVRVRALTPNPTGRLFPGRFVNVDIRLQERETVSIPAYAVVPELKLHKVFLFRGGKAEERIVEVGLRSDERVEITSGIAKGDTVITSALLQLRPGMPVQPLESQGM